MPNYCDNKLIIKGKVEDILKLMSRISGKDDETGESVALTFHKIIPEPATEEDCPAKYVIENAEDARKAHVAYDEKDPRKWFNWYEWRYDKWGTKWDCWDVSAPTVDKILEQNLTEVHIFYTTAWGPARGIMNKVCFMAEEYGVYAKFMWYEPNMEFAGFMDSNGDADRIDCIIEWDEESEEEKAGTKETQDFLDEFWD